MVERIEQRAAALFHVVAKRLVDIYLCPQRHRVDAVSDQPKLIHRRLAGRRNADAKVIVTADASDPCVECREHDVEQTTARFHADFANFFDQLTIEVVVVVDRRNRCAAADVSFPMEDPRLGFGLQIDQPKTLRRLFRRPF